MPPKLNPDVALRVEKAKIAHVLDALKSAGLDEDEELKLDTLEGETNLNELVSLLLAGIEEDEAMIDGLKAMIETRTARRSRLETRIESRKSAIAQLLETARLKSLPLTEATVSLRELKPRCKVIDVDALPDALTRTERKADSEKIKEAYERGDIIPGTVETNGGIAVTIRRR